MRKITLAFVSFLLSATGTLFAQHAKKYADLTLDEYNSEYAEMKKSDDFSVDASGNVTKFKKTLPNLCTIVWEGGTLSKYALDVTITSYDGDVYKGAVNAERYSSVNKGIKFIFSNFNGNHSYEGGPITKDVPLEDMWFLGDTYSYTPEGIITFADKTKSPIKRDRKSKTIRVPIKHAGDYYEKILNLDSIDGGKVIWKDEGWTGDPCRVTLEDGIFIINSGEYLDKTIIYNNGDVYKGAIWYHKNDSLVTAEGDNPGATIIRANLWKANKISDIGRPWYGEMTKADGTVVVIKSGEEDEFETIKRTKIEQAKIEEEKAAAKQQAALNQKYGKKYVDAMLKGQVIIGMPEELIQLGIIIEAFLPHFNIMTTSIDYGNGNVCKDLTLVSTSRLKNVGYIWFNGGKVSSIVYY